MNIPSRYKLQTTSLSPYLLFLPIIFNPTHPDAPDLPLFPFCLSGRAYSSEMTRKTSGSPLPGENSALLPPPAPCCFQTSDSSRFAEALMAIRSVMYLSGQFLQPVAGCNHLLFPSPQTETGRRQVKGLIAATATCDEWSLREPGSVWPADVASVKIRCTLYRCERGCI